jgi:hypothetical protein
MIRRVLLQRKENYSAFKLRDGLDEVEALGAGARTWVFGC